jgi:polysaccharide biosynthesis protein PslH
MRILFATFRLPYPGVRHAGGEYQYRLISDLVARGHEVDVLSFVENEETAHVPELEALVHEVHTVSLAKTAIERFFGNFRYLYMPKFVADAFRRSFVRELLQLTTTTKYNIVQIDYTQMAQYGKYIASQNKTLLEVDVSIMPVSREYEKLRMSIKKLKKLITLTMLKRYEPNMCKLFNLIYVYSEKDRAFLGERIPEAQIHVLTPPVHNDIGDRDSPSNLDILFFGNLGRPPNGIAILWFYDRVFKQFIDEFPSARFIIAGAMPSDQIISLADRPGVVLELDVKDIEPLYINSRVFVSPMMTGGGIIKKNLDALALGCPVVTTRIGNEGIGAPSPEAIAIADEPESFYAAIKRLAIDDDEWQAASKRGRAFVKEHYNWEKTVDGILSDYEKLSENRP